MRMRSAALVFTSVLASVFLPPSAGYAATSPTARITCDRATDTISTHMSGGAGWLLPNRAVTVQFLVLSGSFVTPTTFAPIPAGGGTTVSTTTGPDGSIDIAGYTRTAPLHTYMFYTETVRATVRDAAGTVLIWNEATCSHDERTTVTLTCDRSARTITAAAGGTSYQLHRSVSVWYTWTRTSRPTATEPGFTRRNLNPPDVNNRVLPTAGSWSDVGYVHSISTDPYYLDESVDVVVWATYVGEVVVTQVVVGRGKASCVYANGQDA